MTDTANNQAVDISRTGIRLVVFDWDGTLMDSAAQIVACLHATINDLGLAAMEDEVLKNIIGLGLRESIETLLPGRDETFHQAFIATYRHHWFRSAGSRLFDGVRETLDVCRRHGLLLGVATGKSRRGLDRVLGETGLEAHFDATRCADETPSKPHPRMLLELMDELEVSPSQTLMVGDTEYDMAMATSAGAGKVAVRTGVHSEVRLQRHSPLVCLDHVSHMPDWMSGAGIIGN